jgi:hypothetical protein
MYIAMGTPTTQPKRAPRGVCSKKRIQAGLKPAELQAFDALRLRVNLTRAAFARVLILRAMGADDEEPMPAPKQRHTTSIAED